MAKLPRKSDLGGLPSARTGRPIARYDVSAIGRGAQDLGRGIAQLGAGIQSANSNVDPTQKFEAESKFQEFKWNEKLALDDAMRNVEPGQAGGFANQWADSYQERARAFKQGLPDALKPQYDNKLYGAERSLFGTAANFARQEQKRFSLGKIDEISETYLTRARSAEPLADIKKDFDELVNTNQFLTAIDRDIVKRKAYSEFEGAALETRWLQGDDVERAKILRDLRGEVPEDTAKPQRKRASFADASRASISTRLETGKADPLEGVANISADSAGTRSYGNFGLNSQKGGSIFDFTKTYGKKFGLTAEPGTPEFDAQWRNAAGSAPVELHDAEMRWYADNVTSGVSSKLTGAGVPETLASDPRVQAYFADRMVQQGPASIDGMKKHKSRIKAAADHANGDPVEFLATITELDRAALTSDFPTALQTGVYSERGHDTRLDGRLRLALGVEDGADTALQDATGEAYRGPYANLAPEKRYTLYMKFRDEFRAKQRESAILNGRLPVDPGSSEDRKTIDDTFEKTAVIDGLIQRQWTASDTLARLADKTSYVPERAVETLRGMATNGEADDRHYAYQTLGRIMRVRPGALQTSGGQGLSKSLSDEVETFNTLVSDLGIPPDEAITRIDEMRSPDFKARQSSLKKEAADLVKDLSLNDITQQYGWIFSRPDAGGSDRRASFMLDAYRDAVAYHFSRTADPGLAKKVALNEMMRAYSVSNITGNKRLMRNRPENFYPPISNEANSDPSYQYFSDDLVRTVNLAAGRLQEVDTNINPELRAVVGGQRQDVERGDQIPLEDIYLEANSQTLADIAAGIPYPSYGVVWRQKDENGIPALVSAQRPFVVDVKAARARESAARRMATSERVRQEVEREKTKEEDPARRAYLALRDRIMQELETPDDEKLIPGRDEYGSPIAP